MTVSNSGDLLRMLMPAVSPVPTQNAPKPQAQPIESRSFESLLDEANQAEAAAQAEAPTDALPTEEVTKPSTQCALAGLTGISSIHNASLRQIVSAGVNG